YAARYTQAGLWEGKTLFDIVIDTSQRLPEKVALIDGERQLTYAALRERVERLAWHLRRAGLGLHDQVVVQLPNSLEFVLAYLALSSLGAIPVMALRAHRETEVLHFVRASHAKAYMLPDV